MIGNLSSDHRSTFFHWINPLQIWTVHIGKANVLVVYDKKFAMGSSERSFFLLNASISSSVGSRTLLMLLYGRFRSSIAISLSTSTSRSFSLAMACKQREQTPVLNTSQPEKIGCSNIYHIQSFSLDWNKFITSKDRMNLVIVAA